MRRAGLLVHSILQKMASMVSDGVSTLDLEVEAEKLISDAGAKPAFKGYYSPAAGNKYPEEVAELVEKITSNGGTPLVVSQDGFSEC